MGKKKICNRLSRFGISAVLALGFLTACSNEEPEPEFTVIPPTPKSTQTEDPAEPDIEVDPAEEIAPPELPQFSDDPEEAAEQMVEYFIAAYNYGYQTADPEPLLAVSHSDCGTCGLHIERLEKRQQTGLQTEGGSLSIQEVDYFVANDGSAIAETILLQEAWIERDSSGSIRSQDEGLSRESNFVIVSENGVWKIRAIAVEEPQK